MYKIVKWSGANIAYLGKLIESNKDYTQCEVLKIFGYNRETNAPEEDEDLNLLINKILLAPNKQIIFEFDNLEEAQEKFSKLNLEELKEK